MKNASIKPSAFAQSFSSPLELVCAADSIASLRAAVDNGADCIRLAFELPRTAGHAPSFDVAALQRGIDHAHASKRKVVLEFPSPMCAGLWEHMRKLIGEAERAGIDALAFSDPATMLYCIGNHPNLPLHYAPFQDDLNCGPIRDFHRRFGVGRIVLPPVSSLPLIKQVLDCAPIEVEIRVYGGSSAIIGGRHSLAESREAARSSHEDAQVARFAQDAEEPRSDRCAAAERASNDCQYGAAHSHDAAGLEFVPKLAAIGVRAVRVDTLHHDVARVGRITRVWREALSSCHDSPEHYTVKPAWSGQLNRCARNTGVC